MPKLVTFGRRDWAPLVLCLAGLAAAPQAQAETVQPSPNATVNLINLMVKRGLISRADADGLIAQAADEAAAAARAAAAVPAGGTAVAVPAPDGTVRVQYVPEIVRKQIRDEIKNEVMAQARQDGWATPNAIPDWTQRLTITGDLRTRYEGAYFPKGNADNNTQFFDFNAINTGNPINIDGTVVAPYRNVDQDRQRMRLRARLGVLAALGEGFSAGLRVATGDSSSPVSTNQSLGGSGGNFSKYALWLDRGYLRYQPETVSDLKLTIDVGRFDNPFFATDLIWDDDLGFDGVAASARYAAGGRLSPFVTVGAFPVFNTAFNFATLNAAKFDSHDKWLYAAQGGVDWKVAPNYAVKFGVAYYYFKNVEGKLSSPCTVIDSTTACDTDATRPSFAQQGNTYFPIRNIAPIFPQLQYFGLATPFHELAVTGGLDLAHFDPVMISLDGEYVRNLAFDKKRISGKDFFNNDGADPDGAGPLVGPYEGGDTGYMARLTIGTAALEERWDWNLRFAYKRIESDAVVDGLADSDFGLGGTNLKGYLVGGNLALSRSVFAGLRWQSADSIAGGPFGADVFQADLSARF